MAARQVRVHSPWQSYKRQSIQEAVIRLICREGLKSVTMERVAQEVGIAKGTVYLHYRDKQELLEAVKESALTPVMRKVDEVLRGEGTAEQRLRACAAQYFSYFDEHRDLFRVLIYEREVTRASGSRYQTDRYRNLVQATAGVINDGVRSGEFRAVDAHNVAAMFVESMFALMNQRLRSERPAPVEVDAGLIGDLFVHGLERKKR
jgi:TetR/AcrR family transcriptional regulator, fatty acid metabolism regulator protein